MKPLSLALAFLGLIANPTNAEDPPAVNRSARTSPVSRPRLPDDLKMIDDIVFKQVGETNLDLMLFLPLEKQFDKSPLVVYIHGGGWGNGDKYKVLGKDIIGVVRELNRRGITCASVEYRLANGGEAKVNDSVADCLDAVRYLVKVAATYELDVDRIATFGSSAGGHLTLMTALSDVQDFPCDPSLAGIEAKVRCVAAYYPLVSFVDPELAKGSNFERPQRLIPILGGLLADKLELAKKLSPIERLRPNSPAILLVHGDQDTVLSYKNSIVMRDAAIAQGVVVDCLIVKGAEHGFRGDVIEPSREEISRRTVDFFVAHLTR